MTTPVRNPGNKLNILTGWLPLLWLSLAFLAGIPFAAQVKASTRLWLILAGVALLITLLTRLILPRLKLHLFHNSPSTLLLAMLAFVFFFLGAARFQTTVPSVDAFHIAWYADRDFQLVITGVLVEPSDDRDTYSNLRIEVGRVKTGVIDLPVHGLILARVPPGGGWHYGDVVRVRGHLKTPPSDEVFSYRDYLTRQGILAYMPDANPTHLPFLSGSPILRLVYRIREKAVAKVYMIFPDPEASLLAGILLGVDNGIPADLKLAFQNTGTAHIIAISGFNITIIAGAFVWIFSKLLGKRRGAIAAVIGIILYTLLVGATPSVLRAAIMGTLAILANSVGRRQNGLNTLAFTAGVMAGINPLTLWDVGFQLSFAATLGLILFAQPLQNWFTGLLTPRFGTTAAGRIANPVGQYLLFTLAAQLTTLPVMAYHFGRISLVAVLANPFILPAQPAVEILSGIALLLGFLYLPLGRLAGWIAWPFAAYTDRAVEIFNRFPHGVIVLGEFSLLFVILFYGLLFSLAFAWPRHKGLLSPVLVPSVILVALGIAMILAWSTVFSAPDGVLHLTFLDVGTADAILIQTPGGRALLVDGGASPSQLSTGLGRRLPLFDRRLDWLVIASTTQSEVEALPRTLDRFTLSNALCSGPVAASYGAGQLDGWLSAHSVPVTLAYEGAALDLGEGARLEVSSISSLGSVLLVEWQGFRALLPIGMNLDTLDATRNGKTIGPVTALLLAGSGFDQLNPPEWLANLHPEVVILSVEAGDPDNLPAQTVLDYLKTTTLLRTDRNGWITLSTDGTKFWVEVEKK